MRRLLPLLVALLCLTYFVVPTFARRDFTFVTGQTATSSGDDVTITFTNPIGASNHVYLLVSIATEAQTVSITGTTLTFSTAVGPVDSAGFAIREYIFCAQGDGVDATFVVTTSGAAAALTHGIEFSGGSCTLDGTAQSNDDSDDSNYALTTDVTVTNSNSLLLGHIRSDSAANFNPGGSLTQFGTDGAAGSSEYRILVASGSFDTTWTSTATENALLVGAAFAAAGGGAATPCLRSLLGVGCN